MRHGYLALFIVSILVASLLALPAAQIAKETDTGAVQIAKPVSPSKPIGISYEVVKISMGTKGAKISKIPRDIDPDDRDDPVSCLLTPNPASIAAGASQEFTARCYDERGDEDACPEGGIWDTDAGILLMHINVSTRAILIASERPMDGYIKYQAGSSSLDETTEKHSRRGGFSCDATVAVVGDPDHVELFPGNATVQQGGSQRFTARLVDSAGHSLYPEIWNWSLDGAIGAISESDSNSTIFTAQNVGTGRIMAHAIMDDGRDDPNRNLPVIMNIPTPGRIIESHYRASAQITVTAPTPSIDGGSGGSGGSGGAGGDVYFSIATSGSCTGEQVAVTVSSGGRPVSGVEVKFYLDSGSLRLIDAQTTPGSGTVRFSTAQAGKYSIHALQGSYQESTVIQVRDCAQSELAPSEPSGPIQLEGAETILLKKKISWGSGFSKEVTVTMAGGEASTKVVLTYSPPDGYVSDGYEIIDTIPASVATRISLIRMDSAGEKRSEAPITYAFKPVAAGRTVITYVIARQLTDEMVASLPEPKLQKTVSAQAEAQASGQGIGDSLLASMRGVKNFFTGSDMGMIIGVLVGGLIIVALIYLVAFRREEQKE
jgi:hypothetical protein